MIKNNKNNAQADYDLGKIHFKEGIEADVKTAITFFKRAAVNGHREAQFCLGEIFHDGWGVEEDQVTAFGWLNLACVKGHELAQFLVAGMLAEGKGCDQDKFAAYELYEIIAGQELTNHHKDWLANKKNASEWKYVSTLDRPSLAKKWLEEHKAFANKEGTI